jgi:hypothetical protein
MLDDDLREAFDTLLRPVREAPPPGLPVIRRRLRRRRMRITAATGSVAAMTAAVAILAVTLTGTTPQGSPAITVGPPGGGAAIPVSSSSPMPDQGGYKSTASFTISFRVTSLIVNGQTGAISVIAGRRSAVSVTEKLQYQHTPPAMTRALKGTTLTLGYTCGDCNVGYQIEVPAGTTVRVADHTGGIVLSGLAGPVSASTGTGEISAAGLTSSVVTLHVGTGAITAGFLAPPAAVSASTDTGEIGIGVPGAVSYDVSASTSVGTVKVSVTESASSRHHITANAGVGAVTVVPAGWYAYAYAP